MFSASKGFIGLVAGEDLLFCQVKLYCSTMFCLMLVRDLHNFWGDIEYTESCFGDFIIGVILLLGGSTY